MVVVADVAVVGVGIVAVVVAVGVVAAAVVVGVVVGGVVAVVVVVVVESYFFLINIIVDPLGAWPPPVYLTKLMFSVLTCNKPLTKR